MDETWKVCPLCPAYEASSAGRIRRIGGRILIPRITPNGYYEVRIYRDSGRRRVPARVNRMVCAAFHGLPPTPKHEAAHENGKRLDNAAANLKWKTRKENHADRYRHGTDFIGENNPSSLITREIANQIRVAYAAEPKNAAGKILSGRRAVLCERFGVSRGILQEIISGNHWK